MTRLAAALLLATAAVLLVGVEGLGLNWGTQASHTLPPKVIVQLLKDNGIKKVKLFETNFDAVNALAGSGVEVMLTIPNNMLHDIAGDSGAAKDWVKRNVKRFNFDGGVLIKYVAVGNKPFLEAYKGSFIKVTLPALQNIQNALNDAGVGDTIKATVPLNADVYNSPARNPVPSAGRFRTDISGVMTDIVKFLAKNKAPFTVNIYPFLSLYLNDTFPLDFAFFDGGATPVNDNGVMYNNVYEANFDTLVAALVAVGHGDMPIIVGEVGWPTDGDLGAKIDNACSNADCTPLGYGSTCNGMDAKGNASYAFNAYYQAQSQKDEPCDFQGLALPTETDPSTATCNFTIQIVTSGVAATRLGVAAVAAALLVALLQLSSW